MPATSSAGATAPSPGAVTPATSGAALAAAGAPAISAGAAATLAAVSSPAPAPTTCTPATLTLLAAGFSGPGATTSAGGIPGRPGVPGDVIEAGDGAVVEVVGPPGAPAAHPPLALVAAGPPRPAARPVGPVTQGVVPPVAVTSAGLFG